MDINWGGTHVDAASSNPSHPRFRLRYSYLHARACFRSFRTINSFRLHAISPKQPSLVVPCGLVPLPSHLSVPKDKTQTGGYQNFGAATPSINTSKLIFRQHWKHWEAIWASEYNFLSES